MAPLIEYTDVKLPLLEVEFLEDLEELLGSLIIPHLPPAALSEEKISYAKKNLGFSSTHDHITLLNCSCFKNPFPKQFSQTIPPSIGNLKHLTDLILYADKLYDIPEEIGHLTALVNFKLSRNRLSKLPDTIGNLNSLETLDLSENHLDKIPDSFGNLRSLKKLNLNQNQLTDLPESFGKLNSLQNLDLSNNPWIAFPTPVQDLKKLTQLCMLFQHGKVFFHNENVSPKISLPDWIGKLKTLEKMTLSGFEGETLPDSFGNLSNLKYVSIQRSNICRIPDSIQKLKRLEYLDLSFNQLCELPDSFGELTSLKQLFLRWPTKNGLRSLPDMSEMKSIKEINVENNKIESIPDWIGELTNLEFLNISNNPVALDSFPKSLKNLTALKRFSFGKTYHGDHLLPHWLKDWLQRHLPRKNINFGYFCFEKGD